MPVSFQDIVQGAAGLADLGNSVISGINGIGAGRRQRKLLQRQYYYNQQLMNQQHALSEQSAEAAYQRQLDFWNQQNEYLSPSNQKALLEQAGLNPYVLNGSSGVSGGSNLSSMNAGSAAGSSVSLPGIVGPHMGAVSGSLAQARLSSSQAKLNEAQADYYSTQADEVLPAIAANQQAQADLSKAKVITEGGVQALQTIEQQLRSATLPTSIAQAEQDLSTSRMAFAQLYQDYEIKSHELDRQPLLKQQLEQQVKLASLNVAYRALEAQLYSKYGDLERDASLKQALALTRSYLSSADNYDSMIELRDNEQAEMYNQLGRKFKRETNWMPVRNVSGAIRDLGDAAGSIAGIFSRFLGMTKQVNSTRSYVDPDGVLKGSVSEEQIIRQIFGE